MTVPPFDPARAELAPGISGNASARALFGAAIAAILLFALEDRLLQRDLGPQLLLGKGLQLAVLAVVFGALSTDWGRQRLYGFCMLGGLTLLVGNAQQMMLIGDPNLGLMSITVVTLAIGATIPWPVAYQATLAGAAWLSIAHIERFVRGETGFSSPAFQATAVTGLTIAISWLSSRRHRALRQAQAAFLQSEEQFRQLAEHSNDIIWVWSPDRRVQFISPSYERVTGRPPEPLLSDARHAVRIVHRDDRAVFGEALEAILAGGERRLDLRLRNAEGRYLWFEGWGAAVKDQKGRVQRCIGVWHDVTERVELAATDALTGLLNRRALGDRLQDEQQRSARSGRPFCVVIADLDHFKRVNDTYGHETGDRALVMVADALRRPLRRTDAVGRWGGEEFLIILPGTSLEPALRVAENLSSQIKALRLELPASSAGGTADASAGSLSFTMTFGVAEHVPGTPHEDTVRRADEALYRGKAEGRDRVRG